jgi:tetratricopeptide (TPR) repeat protein
MSLQRLAESESYLAIPVADEEVLQRCRVAKDLEAAGEHEAARGQLADRWQRVGERPKLEGLGEVAQAELLLRAGTLSGWIGSTRQMEGAQEFAKDLISESARRFDRLGLDEKVADARVDLAVCYWREGALDEARVTLNEVLGLSLEEKCEPKLRAVANLALLERVAGRFREALDIQTKAAPLFNDSSNHPLRGNFHNVHAQVLKELGVAERREDYIDRALVEFTAASYHFEQAGNVRFQASIENNLGSLFRSIGKYRDAYDHLNHARSLFVKLKDKGNVARVDETYAQTLICEGRYSEAANVVRNSVRVFEEGDERSALAEALVTHGTALARLNNTSTALSAFNKAIRVAELAGDPHAKGLAAIAVVEELSASVDPVELRRYYDHAESVFPGSQNPGIQTRLGQCARKVLAAESRSSATAAATANESHNHLQSDDVAQSLSLEEEVLRYEADLIKNALDTSGGSVTRAARKLGITHQGLAFILNGRHKSLLSARKPAKPRRRSIIRYH